jgi:hypothetical protein
MPATENCCIFGLISKLTFPAELGGVVQDKEYVFVMWAPTAVPPILHCQAFEIAFASLDVSSETVTFVPPLTGPDLGYISTGNIVSV